MNKTRTSLLAIFAAVSAMTSCQELPALSDAGCAPLEIRVTATPTKAMITGTELASGSAIGVSLQQNGQTTYDGTSYANVKCTANGSGASQKWTPASSILLSTTTGTLYGYYPHSGSVTSVTSVPVSASSSVQTDYMWAAPVGSLNNRNTSASLTMKHALAAITVSTVRGTYTGTGTVSKVEVKGSNLATSATLDATTGTLKDFSGAGTAIAPAMSSYALSTTAKDNGIIVIPTGQSAAITISVTIDGQVFTATTSAADLAEGTVTKYTVTANSETLVINKVSVTPWASGAAESLTLKV